MSYNFEELCLPCYPELVAFAAKRTKSRAAAEDIVQESVARALKSWRRWEPKGEPRQYARAWMFRIVTNTFGHFYQQQKQETKAETINAPSVAAELYQHEAYNHPYLVDNSLGDEVREALGRIRPEWAKVVQLVYIDGVDAAEAAKTLGLPPGTIRSSMARGRLALARILSPLARRRFGLLRNPESLSGADEALAPLKASETPQAEPHSVDCIVAEDNAGILSVT